jgi:hypothetical protein
MPTASHAPDCILRRSGAIAASLALAVVLAGCESMNTTRVADRLLPASTIIPDSTVKLAPSVSVSVEALVGAALVVWYVDPLAPNWEVRERPLGADRVRFELRQKRYNTGGDGEAGLLIRRRAGELAREAGLAHFEVVEQQESVDSQTLGARRMVTAEVRLLAQRPARPWAP